MPPLEVDEKGGEPDADRGKDDVESDRGRKQDTGETERQTELGVHDAAP